MRTPAFLCALIALVALGCASKTPETTRYLLPLETPSGTARLNAPVQIGLGRIVVANYLGTQGIVIETHEHEVRPARYHLWAEPLTDGLRRFLRTEISQALGSDIAADTPDQSRWDRTIDVSIDRLHGDLSGKAILNARWRIRGKGGADARFRFTETMALPRGGYGGLVEAEVELLRRLAAAIAASLSG